MALLVHDDYIPRVQQLRIEVQQVQHLPDAGIITGIQQP
jgi:hypothetical protein